jgi:non-ribosomal peptide synthetase component F
MSTAALWSELAAAARRHRSSLAYQAPGVALGYGELAASAEELARALAVPPGTGVGVLAPAGPLEVLAAWTAWAAGAAFVPLPPGDPTLRLARRLAQLPLSAVLVGDQQRGLAQDACQLAKRMASWKYTHGTNCLLLATDGRLPDGCAAVYSTSGSTGEPRYVAVTQQALLNVGRWALETQEIGPGSRVTGAYPATFDAFLQVLLEAQLSGGCMIGAPSLASLPGPRLRRWLRAERISHLDITPTLLSRLRDGDTDLPGEPAILPDLRVVVLGGEQVPWAAVDTARRLSPTCRVFNMYGPTEATVTALSYEVPGGVALRTGSVPIGAPIPGMRADIRGGSGDEGELVLSGVGVALGYLQGASGGSVTVMPFTGGEYHTGDLVQIIDGELVFGGRADRQLSLHGLRVEAGEVEHVARSVPGVEDAFACTFTVEGIDRLGLAYVTAPRHGVNQGRLREELRRLLPAELLPRRLARYRSFPVTPNGKRDERQILQALLQGDAYPDEGDHRKEPA